MAGIYNADGSYNVTVVGGTLTGGTGASANQTQGPAASGSAAVGNPVYVGSRVDTTATGPAAEALGDVAPFWLTAKGALVIGGYSAAASNTAAAWANQALISLPSGAAGYLATFPYKSNGTAMDLDRKPNAASRIPSAAASTNATVAKASAGDLHIISGNNASGAIRYLKFYDVASAPTVGTTTIELMLVLPTGAFSFNMNGHYFGTGIAYAMTTGAADADTGALTAADVLGLSITYA